MRCKAAVLLMALMAPAARGETAIPPAQIAVSPSRFELQIGPRPTTHSLNVMNMGRGPVTIEVAVATWDLDEANAIRILEPTETSLDQWMVINPLRFTIPAKSTQTVRFSIRPKVVPEPGEHRAMIYLNQVLDEAAPVDLSVKFSFGVAVYGMAGEVTREGRLNAVVINPAAGPPLARFDISSLGSAHVRMNGQYAIYHADDYPGVEATTIIPELGRPGTELPEAVVAAGLLPARPILPGTRRTIPLDLAEKLAPGRYVLDINGELPGEPIDKALSFAIVEPSSGKEARNLEGAPQEEPGGATVSTSKLSSDRR